MTNMERLIVNLPADIVASVHKSVAEGDYVSASDVVREALEAWARKRGDGAAGDIERLREAVRVGLDSGAPIPAETVLSELRARYAAKG